jgi:prephenate dehydrogenase
MQRITIIGLGRVGASMGLAIKRWISAPEAAQSGRSGIEVVGFDYDHGVQKAAERLGAVDRTGWSLSRALQDAALVVLAVPATEERALLQEIAPLLSDGAIVTDTGGHKQQGLRWATELLPEGVHFVAGHPVLATPEDGEPSAELFSGVTYAVFPHPDAEQSATEVVVGLVQAIGAKPYFPEPSEHDAQVAATTLLPALAAAALMHAASAGAGWRDLRGMATSDLAEVTRLASVQPGVLAGMVGLSPQEAVRWLDSLIARLGELRDLAARNDPEAHERLEQFFRDARAAREEWLRPASRESAPESRETLADQFNRMFLGGMGRRRR